MADFTKQQVIETGKTLIQILLNACNTQTKNSLDLQHYMDDTASDNGVYAAQNKVLASFSDVTGEMMQSADTILEKMSHNKDKMGNMQTDFATLVQNINTMQKNRAETDKNIAAVNEKIDTINASVANVEDVAQLTNILSFNASIEAARAGEAGKGFRVIANEVKDLSDNTTNLSRQITKQVAELKILLGRIVAENDQKSKFMDELQKISSDSADAIEEIKFNMGENAKFTQSLINNMDAERNEILTATEKVKEGNIAQIRQIADNASSQTIQINDETSFLLQLRSILEWLEEN